MASLEGASDWMPAHVRRAGQRRVVNKDVQLSVFLERTTVLRKLRQWRKAVRHPLNPERIPAKRIITKVSWITSELCWVIDHRVGT